MSRGTDLAIGDGRADKSTPRDVGARLREIRGKRSRQEFGSELNTHRNTIERYEKGLRPVDDQFLALVIEKNPRWSLHWLRTGHGDKHEAAERAAAHQLGEPLNVSYGTSIDDALLAAVMREIETAFGKHYERVSTEKRAALIAAVYDDARSRGQVSRETVLRLVKLTI